jgi:hypothetical protein
VSDDSDHNWPAKLLSDLFPRTLDGFYEGIPRSVTLHMANGQIWAPWVYDDGGRAAAGYKGNTGDCVVRAIAIAAELPYEEVYEALYQRTQKLRLKRERNKSPRLGVLPKVFRPYLESMGWEFVPTMGLKRGARVEGSNPPRYAWIGTGCRVHLRPEELPSGRLICSVSGHLVAVIDGVARDTYDPTREGTRCVYGYFQKMPPVDHPRCPCDLVEVEEPDHVPDYQI